MWLNEQQITDPAIRAYRKTLKQAIPNYLVIDQLFDNGKLQQVCRVLQQNQHWQTQQHTYDALYVKNATWQKTPAEQRFVQRDLWQRPVPDAESATTINAAVNVTNNVIGNPGSVSASSPENTALAFLHFLRGAEFMALLSRIFRVQITDISVANPALNTNYFRLGPRDFVNQHADDSPGREVCMLLYLNEDWQEQQGGELVFSGNDNTHVTITPLFNRCVLFDPSSPGSEHWVNAVNAVNAGNNEGTDTDNAEHANNAQHYRYNLTSWYWSE
ncbi:MAG: 2OG-Fe(II) oxygenase [Gammaproteobacteria bacterium]|nr:2OG-Fe(II) oxygenase [Gammaproteobacteria bacterium]MBU2280429.1 2OG-Fe(II) oxygenase [Gammaproteobacteria bacterium]